MSTKPKKKSIPKVVKDLSWNKWIGEDVARTKCMCCGINEIKMSSFHCGHIIAEANGGKLSIENLKPICSACNLSMGTENMDDFRMRCGFTSQATHSTQSLPIAKKNTSIGEAVIPRIKLLLMKDILKKCPGRGFPLTISEINGAACPDSDICSKHCNSCGYHYHSGPFGYRKCPCK